MPHYYNSKNNQYFGNIVVTPYEWYRKIRIGNKSPVPYKVMDEVKFWLQIEKMGNPGVLRNDHYIWVRNADGSWDSGQSINDVNKPVLIRAKAKYTGDVKIFLTINVPPTSQPVREGNAIELFYEDVRSSNYYIFGIGGIILASFLTGICSFLCVLTAWLLNFFQILPLSKIWIVR
jgi:hypothetical protein